MAAAAAETLGFIEASPAGLTVLPGGMQETVWFNADDIPYLRDKRQEADNASEELYEARKQQLQAGEFQQVPYEVDPLSTAARVIKAKKDYGTESLEYELADQALVDDVLTLIEEALAARMTGVLSPAFLSWSRGGVYGGHYESRGIPMLGPADKPGIVDNGITPVADPWLYEIRVAERREEVTYTVLAALGDLALRGEGVEVELCEEPVFTNEELPAPDVILPKPIREADEVTIMTISQCPQEMIDLYRQDVAKNYKRHSGYKGFNPEDETLMIRFVTIDMKTLNRREQQAVLPGGIIGHEVILRYMKNIRLVSEAAQLTKTEVLGVQAITAESMKPEDILAELDRLATQMNGVNTAMGRKVPDGHVCDYDALEAERLQRRKVAQRLKPELKEYLLTLVEESTDSHSALGSVHAKVDEIVMRVAKNDADVARGAFGEEAAKMTSAAILAEVHGDFEMARRLRERMQETAAPVVFCGAGSCGLEAVDSARFKETKAIGFQAGDTLLRDTVRACVSCKSRTVVYAFNSKKINKLCTACGAFDSKQGLNGKSNPSAGRTGVFDLAKKRRERQKNLVAEMTPAVGRNAVKPAA